MVHIGRPLKGHSSVKTLERFYIRSGDANEDRARKVLEGLLPAKTGGDAMLANSAVNRQS